MNTPEGKPWIDPDGVSKIPAYRRKEAKRNFLVEEPSPVSQQDPELLPAQEGTQERAQELPSLEAEFHSACASYPNLRVLMLDQVKSPMESGNTDILKEQIGFIKINPALTERFNEILNPSISNEEALTIAREVNLSLDPKPIHKADSRRIFECTVGSTGRRAIIAVSKNGRIDFEVSNR